MTWKIGGYRGEEVAIRTLIFVKLMLEIATSSPHISSTALSSRAPARDLFLLYDRRLGKSSCFDKERVFLLFVTHYS
jgi:hypothetical protein